MGYTDQFLKAKEKGHTTQVTTEIYTFQAEGDEIVGKVVKIEPFSEATFDTEVNKYIFETDNGTISTVLGAATDKQLASRNIVGKLVHVVYHGKKQIKEGRQVNLFTVEVAE